MRYRNLGHTGISVSEIAFGGVEIGLPYGIGVHTKADMLSKKQAVHLLHEGLDNGINFFDTARLYGESEAIMGDAFQARRKEVIIATKCTHIKDASGNIPPYQQLKSIIESSLQESCQFLKTDYVDVFMLHQADIEILANEDVHKIFSDLKQSGCIRATGVSTYDVGETKLAIEQSWDVIQVPFNMIDQRQQEAFELARKKNTALVARSVLMKGLLSERGRNLHTALKKVEEHIRHLRTLLNGKEKDISATATKFVLSFEAISSVLIGIDSSLYLQKAIATLKGEPFDHQDMKELAYPNPEFLDLPKWDRMGWLK